MASDQMEQADSAALQSQNQRLVQQLEAQKHETHELEVKMKELKDIQGSYDATLISTNKLWNQLVDDLVLLGIRAGGEVNFLNVLDHKELSAETIQSCVPENLFLCTVMRLDGLIDGNHDVAKLVQDALSSRQSETMALMNHLQNAIEVQKARNESLASALCGNLPAKDVVFELQRHNEHMKAVLENMHKAIDFLHEKHAKLLLEIENYTDRHRSEKLEIKSLSVELDENLAELEQRRRKLVVLQMQKHGGSVINSMLANAANGSCVSDKYSGNTALLQEVKGAVEEAKTLAENRLLELQEAQEDNIILSKQLEDLEGQVVDEKYIFSSKQYTLLDDQLQNFKKELARYKGIIELLQSDREDFLLREKELIATSESVDNLKRSIGNYDGQIERLENQLQILIGENNDLEIKVEEAIQDTGKRDFKDEVHVMAASLSKEMKMMENQLNRSKDAALEALRVRKEADTLKAILTNKKTEHKTLLDKREEQVREIKSLNALIENLEKEKEELMYIVDMYGQECFDARTLNDIEESESRARQQAEYLRRSLEEHSLELRVKAASEAQVALQHRLSIAEAEIAELRTKLDASERDVLALKESIKVKDTEAEAYIAEIEMIGQAYEDMQTQNQHLLKQVADRDDYHIKLVSESVNLKQSHSSILSEKQLLLKQLQQINGSLELSTSKVNLAEEQMHGHISEALKTSAESRRLALNLEKANLELVDAEKEVKWLRAAIGSSKNDYEENLRKIEELKSELERERRERKKIEEEYEEVKNEVMEMTAEDPEVTMQKLQDEIRSCKAILKCGVCFNRPKEVVITKCYHLFCSRCIQRNLETRHRKCPGCGTPFGQSDVREVKI